MTLVHIALLVTVLGTNDPLTLESDRLLQMPDSLGSQADSFEVAKTGPRVDVVFWNDLPPAGKATLWSSWGDGCLSKNGKYYTSVGDHRGRDATSYIYEFDPTSLRLRRVVDVAEVIGQEPGAFGHGKIHSGIHESRNGWLYFATYWGKHREVEEAFGTAYQGSILMRYHPHTGRTENYGAIVPQQGLPASYFDSKNQLLYFHVVYDGKITVVDVNGMATPRADVRSSSASSPLGNRAATVRFLSEAGVTDGARTFIGDLDGRVFFSGPGGRLHLYDPNRNAIEPTALSLPAVNGAEKGATLRASTRPTQDNIVYGMTQSGRLFALHSTPQQIRDLGPNFGNGDYTAVMVLSPDEQFLYYAPGAHGSGVELGTPIVQYQIATGRRKVLAFLNEELRRSRNYNLGGTYNLQMDATGERLFCTFNGAPWNKNSRKPEAFGQPCVVVVTIPASERPPK